MGNGKSVDQNGVLVHYQTGLSSGANRAPTDSTFYQHPSGRKMVPADFMILETPIVGDHHKLMSNFLAQTRRFAFGKTLKVEQEGTPYELVPFNI